MLYMNGMNLERDRFNSSRPSSLIIVATVHLQHTTLFLYARGFSSFSPTLGGESILAMSRGWAAFKDRCWKVVFSFFHFNLFIDNIHYFSLSFFIICFLHYFYIWEDFFVYSVLILTF